MSQTMMNLHRIRDLVSNLGWKGDDNSYMLGPDCLKTLETLENEILNEDLNSRNVRIALYMSGITKTDLIPILIYGKDFKTVAVVTRVLMSLSLPVECLMPCDEAHLTPKHTSVWNQLFSACIDIKKAFLDNRATYALVTMLRENIYKSENFQITLKKEVCFHLKNCLCLLRNLLHIQDNLTTKNSKFSRTDFHALHNKLIRNLFVQGVDGALLLMSNSKHRIEWIIPISFIIALLYKNQNIEKITQVLEMISLSSDSSGEDEESDGSKHSSASLSSEISKVSSFNDSGCPLTSDSMCDYTINNQNVQGMENEYLSDLSTTYDTDKAEKNVQNIDNQIVSECNKMTLNNYKAMSKHEELCPDDGNSISCNSYKKMKGNDYLADMGNLDKFNNSLASNNIVNKFPDDDDMYVDKNMMKNLEAVQILRCLRLPLAVSESDSSNEDYGNVKQKFRNHPPVLKRFKIPRRNNCNPSICLSSAIMLSHTKDKIKFPLWNKRKCVSSLVDANSTAPSNEDIGCLLKEFTLSFMHCGFSELIVELKDSLELEPDCGVDKSLLLWFLCYFLHLATNINLSLIHLKHILSLDVINYLVGESVFACEAIELFSQEEDKNVIKSVTTQLGLLVTALKRVMTSTEIYAKKSNSLRDKAFIQELCVQISKVQDVRQLPLLLFRIWPIIGTQQFLDDAVILNHQIILILEQGSANCKISQKFDLYAHLKQFAIKSVVNCYATVLDNFISNSQFLNKCAFTMMHHFAGDLDASHLLVNADILKIFSGILNEDTELEQYQEDLILYIINKMKRKIVQERLKQIENTPEINEDSPKSACSLDEDLIWWYLQFKRNLYPTTKILECVGLSEEEISVKLSNHVDPSYDKENKYSNSVDITHQLYKLVELGEKHHLTWLQNILLETCYNKLGGNKDVSESVTLHSMKMRLSVPLVPFTEDQKSILENDAYLELLKRLGLHLSSGHHNIYPRIPLAWSAEMLFDIASQLGPIISDKLKFSYDDLLQSTPSNLEPINESERPVLPPLPSCVTSSSWLSAVHQNKEKFGEPTNNLLLT